MTYTETVGRLLLATHALYSGLPIDASEVEKALDCGDALGLAETDDHRAPRRLLGDPIVEAVATASVTGVERRGWTTSPRSSGSLYRTCTGTCPARTPSWRWS